MANMIDYVKWRGDVSLDSDSIHAIDALILTNLGYIHFDELLENNKKTIGQLGKEFMNLPKETRETKCRVVEDEELLLACMNSSRFSCLEISDFLNQYDFEQEMQFSAMSVHTPNGIVVVFRGTDGSFVGWKEDFNMFSREEIPAQRMAIQYLETIAQRYPKQPIRVAGHSKGGNLAIYSVVKSNQIDKNRIQRLYNFDGPGFSEGFLELSAYQDIRHKIQMVVPQSSFFGMIFNHDVKMEIVKSNQIGVMQHDAYSWEVEGSAFVHVKELSTTSKLLENTLNHVLEKLTVEQRKQLVDIIYMAFVNNATNEVSNWFKNVRTVIKEAQTLDAEKTAFLSESFSVFVDAARSSISETILPWKKTSQENVASNTLLHQLNVEGAYNVRELGGYLTPFGVTNEHVFLRSDGTSRLTSNDIDWLKAKGLTTVIDLRSSFEKQRELSVFENRTDIDYFSVPMLDQIQSSGMRNLPKSLLDTYIGLLEGAKKDYQQIFELLANAPGMVLFHCTAGKDRTGVLAMLLLDLVGVDHQSIVQDYAITRQLIEPLVYSQLAEMTKAGIKGLEPFFDSRPKTMMDTLDYLVSHYQDAYHYCLSCGINEETIEKIKNKLVK